MSSTYESIEDWSFEARAALVSARGDEIRLLLDLAFTTFIDEEDLRLSEFGFRGEDPVDEAVAWCVETFATRDLDPSKLHAESRSFRLFTEVSFWLSQKVGTKGYRRIRARRPSPLVVEPAPEGHDEAASLREMLGAACRRLARTTTAALVTWWLLGSARFRRACFDWEDDVAAPETMAAKNASFATADALWRYLCLYLDLIDDAVPVARASLFTPCSPTFRYEVDKAEVGRRLQMGVREVERVRKGEVLSLVLGCLAVAEEPLDRDSGPSGWVRIALARESLKDSLFHHYRLDRTDDAALRVKALPRGIR